METGDSKYRGSGHGSVSKWDFERLKRIAEGSTGVIYQVRYQGKDYAMKVPLFDDIDPADEGTNYCGDPELARFFENEVANWVTASEKIPDSVVRLMYHGTDRYAWMVMELADTDFEKAMTDGTARIQDFLQILEDLQRLHDIDIIHGDIKPRNILRVNGRWKLSDFGSSVTEKRGRDDLGQPGTLMYMAPEQFEGSSQTVDKRTDLWQVGIMLYRYLMKGFPYKSKDAEGIAYEIMHSGPDLSDIDVRYLQVLSKSLAVDKECRYSDADEFREALAVVCGERSEMPRSSSDTFASNMEYYKGAGQNFPSIAYKKFIDSGDRMSKTMAALISFYGWGIPKDPVEASVSMRKLWTNLDDIPRDPDGLWIKAMLMATEKFGHYRQEEVLEVLQQSALHGSCLGQYAMYQRTGTEGLTELRLSAEQGFTPAEVKLAEIYRNGTVVGRDMEKYIRWTEAAAKGEHVQSQWEMGQIYEKGELVEASPEDAFRWYAAAAKHDFPQAQLKVARMFEDGIGTGKSVKDAVYWYNLAALNGVVDAQYGLAVLLEDPENGGTMKDAYSWYLRAAEGGNHLAQLKVGKAFLEGKFLEKSYDRALFNFAASAQCGLPEAQ